MEKSFWDNLSESAKDALAKAGVELGELKDAASDKWAEWSEKAEKLAAEGNAEAKEKLAELKAMREKLAAHEGGALGFLSDKASAMLGETKEQLGEVADKGKDFWEKTKEYVGDKAEDVRDTLADLGTKKPDFSDLDKEDTDTKAV